MIKTFTEYEELAQRTVRKDMTNEQLQDFALHGISSEIGEIHGILQKVYQGHELDLNHIKKELGDVLWFLRCYTASLGFTLEEVATANIEKLKARYKDGFTAEESLHRADGDV